MGNSRRLVEGMSGHCRHNGYEGAHQMCSWGQGVETPSAIVTCVCPCHAVKKLVPKSTAKVLVPKS